MSLMALLQVFQVLISVSEDFLGCTFLFCCRFSVSITIAGIVCPSSVLDTFHCDDDESHTCRNIALAQSRK